MRVLVTGGCGFLGSHFVRSWLARHEDTSVVNVDSLTYAGSLDNLEEAADDTRYRHKRIDITDAPALDRLWSQPFDLIVHFAAESHVDRSLEDAGRFVRTNVLGTQTLLEVARRERNGNDIKPTVIIISTDEVYGPTPLGQSFGTDAPLRPRSPYAASKAAADWMALAYARSFDMDVTLVRPVNVYGPRQYPEKIIPLFVTRALAGEKLPLYGEGLQRRCWLFVSDLVDGLMRIIENPERRSRQVWHLGSVNEVENRELAAMLCRLCEADPELITSVADRPGHDRRYALEFADTTHELGWQPRVDFEDGLRQTVEWVRANQEWCRRRTGWTPAFLQED